MAAAGELVQEVLFGEGIAHGHAAVFLCDDTLRYLAVNDAACALLELERKELLALRASDVVERPEEELVRAAQRVSDGHLQSGRTTLRRRNGTRVPVRYVSFPTQVGGLAYVLTVAW